MKTVKIHVTIIAEIVVCLRNCCFMYMACYQRANVFQFQLILYSPQ